MKRLLAVLAFVNLAVFGLRADERSLPESVAPLRGEQLRLVRVVGAIDRDLLSTLTKKFTGVARLANPRERFEATDVHSDAMLPTRRLILAGIGSDHSFIAYEHGGRGYHLH